MEPDWFRHNPFLNFGTSGVGVTGRLSSGFMNMGSAISGMGNVGDLALTGFNFVSGMENIGHRLAGLFFCRSSSTTVCSLDSVPTKDRPLRVRTHA